jgi:hypothetical protein
MRIEGVGNRSKSTNECQSGYSGGSQLHWSFNDVNAELLFLAITQYGYRGLIADRHIFGFGSNIKQRIRRKMTAK